MVGLAVFVPFETIFCANVCNQVKRATLKSLLVGRYQRTKIRRFAFESDQLRNSHKF